MRSCIAFLISFLALFEAPNVYAATISDTHEFSIGWNDADRWCNNYPDDPTECYVRPLLIDDTHYFDAFDPALGVLTQIDFDTTVAFDFVVHYHELDLEPKTTETEIFIQFGGDSAILSPSVVFSGSIITSRDECAGCQSVWSYSDTQHASLTNLLALEVFGDGTRGPRMYAYADGRILGGGLLDIYGTGLINEPLDGFRASMTMTYHYDPVPEPGTSVLFSVGLIGMAWSRRPGRPA